MRAAVAVASALPLALTSTAAALIAGVAPAAGESPRFPEGFEKGVRYAVVDRGDIRDEIYTSAEALAAVKAGRPIPSGTVVTMVDRRGGELFRYVVMEKRTGLGHRVSARHQHRRLEISVVQPGPDREGRRRSRALHGLPQAAGGQRLPLHTSAHEGIHPMIRKTMIVASAAAALGAATPAGAESVKIFPNGSRPSAKPPEAYFSGSVRLDPQFGAPNETNLSAGHVTFEPGARSAWHTHPAGQLLIISSGVGWVQEEGQPKREFRAGDVVWIPAGVKHWHGATATNGMSHHTIQESRDGKNVDWLEKVTDGQYAAPAAGSR